MSYRMRRIMGRIRFWQAKPREVSPDDVDHPDEKARSVIARAFSEGRPVVGGYNADGEWEEIVFPAEED